MTEHTTTRRQVLSVAAFAASAGALSSLGCASSCPKPTSPRPEKCPVCPGPDAGLIAHDTNILAAPAGPLPIVQRVPGGVNVLRHRARLLSTDDQASRLALLERRMRETLASTGRGVGLAAPQVGISARAIVVMLGARGKHPSVRFFVNPRIVERSDAISLDFEGCLSVPDVVGLVKRSKIVTIEHGLPGRPRKRLSVLGFDARIFQHEIDHLDGILYIDRVEGETAPKEQLKKLREELRARRPKLACTPMFYGRYQDEVLL